MGEVYRARDSKLNRDVAIKVLPDAFARDSDRLARFQREAQVLASLNHPNIAAIYGLEESDTIRALVMELVEGPTLDDPVWRGDGKEIFFVRDEAVWSVKVTGSADSPAFSAPEKLFAGVRRAPTAVFQSQGLSVSRDGSRFFIVQGVEQPDTNVIHIMMSAHGSR